MKWTSLRRWRPSRIGPRLLAFNLLVVFVPIVGLLYLDVYEARLLQAQEREMVQQARLLAAVLGDAPDIDTASIHRTFERLARRTEARLRVFDARGSLLADSRTVKAAITEPEGPTEYSTDLHGSPSIRQRALYRLGAWVHRVREHLTTFVRYRVLRRQPTTTAGTVESEAEVQQALQGRYGAATRRTPGQRSLTLVSALPVRHNDAITGAVVVSQSTFRILQALYDVRLRVFEIVVASMAAAALLTAIAAMNIVRPLKQLRRQANALAARRSPLPARFPGTNREDEIGALARALEQLTNRLDAHIELLESFAADLSHEFRNPLASIRAAAETIGETEDPSERARFLDMMRRDVDRLERLVAGVREVARIDRQIEHETLEHVDVRQLVTEIVETTRLVGAEPRAIELKVTPDRCVVRATRARLAQAFENLLSNALSFSPAGTAVEVGVEAAERVCRITVADRGPGIPEAHLPRLFDRFFSYRPAQDRREHLGLGLAIAKQIVVGYGGSIAARNRGGGGADFEITLPLVD